MTDRFHPTTLDRQRTMLRTAMGPAIATALIDPAVIEVMVNPDGRLWIDRHGDGRVDTGERLEVSEAERIIRLVASHIGQECHRDRPVVSAELPETGERFEGLLPPVSPSPCFAIRKPARVLYRLSDYVDAQIMTPLQAKALREAVEAQKNIVVVGGTSSGKTTLVNALLAEVAASGDRVILIEDTRELHCAAEDCVSLRTKPGVAALSDLVRSTLRLRPDRIIVGEVRGPEALDMLKAWNTGHPGGITTLHANSAHAGLYRLEQLIQEVVVTVPRRLIAEAIDIVVFLKGRGSTRRVETVAALEGLASDGDYRLKPLTPIQLVPCV
ncbi:conjugal transfer protein TrbB [Thalassospira profundimaris]|uniref:Conjugal transfer protein TrbB n=1 Tax=Thalassospira profundimaris TaxID=502049 RepID=A0A367WXK6_9PROT|nr:P-type conjugative transfer ATPase TrbB [Thalassospira profundimaris]RCK45959.1 conjugal transfer protein TrbB [Thalassospira profundimaris]